MDAFFAGLAAVADPQILFLVVAGTVLGVVVGALPGISGSTTTALLLPLAITMTPNAAIAFLGSIYCAANFGGSITAILINTPGDPSASATAFDGYPAHQFGRREMLRRAAHLPHAAIGLAPVGQGLFDLPLENRPQPLRQVVT